MTTGMDSNEKRKHRYLCDAHPQRGAKVVWYDAKKEVLTNP